MEIYANYFQYERLLDYLRNITPELVLKLTGASLIGFGVYYFGKILSSYRFFKKRGLKTPEYELFFGNYREIKKENKYSNVLKKWTEKYGKTYGYFEGHLPVLVTSDLEIIQEIFVKQYANFSARKKGPLVRTENSKHSNLFTSTKSRWKKMRTIMNPTFSSSKLKELGPLLIKCSDRLLDVFDKEKERDINVADYFKKFTMDSIWNCAFGIDIDLQNDSKNDYFDRCESVFRQTSDLTLYAYLGVYFHEFKENILVILMILNFVMSKIVDPNYVHPFYWLRSKVVDIVENRKVNETGRKDYVQLLLDAESDYVADDNHSMDFANKYVNKKLTFEEIKMNLVLFMLAGYETTSTALSYCSYVLAIHPEEQEKLYEEISCVFSSANDSNINSESVQKLDYLDMFIKEVLRMYPIGNSVVARRCTKATNIKSIDIPEDLAIAVDVLSLHYDAEIWGPVDPNQFYPERFSKDIKRNPLAFMAFGNGPRNCIGMKFAIIEMKIALVKLLLNFELKKSSKTCLELDFNEGIVRQPKNGIDICFKKRV
nr:cytochrome p450 CYP3045C2 [Brachionus angularis]